MELSRREFFELLQRFESNPEPEEIRRTARVVLRRHVTIITDWEIEGGRLEVVLHDISRGGVCLTHHEGMPKDKEFTLLLPDVSGTPLPMVCVVRHCGVVHQHRFRIGAEFKDVD